MEMERKETHIMLIPFPAQGHMNPMMQFAKRLVSKGVRVTLVAPADLKHSLQLYQTTSATASMINIEYMSYDFDENEIPYTFNMQYYMGFVRLKVKNNLTKLIEKQKISGQQVNFLVVDSLYPSGVEMARQLGLKGGPFFTQSCAVGAIYYHAHQGGLKIPLPDGKSTVSLPSLPLLGVNDLPILDIGTFQDFLSHFSNQFSDIEKADWIFFNSFDKLENEEAKWLSGQWPITTIGPLIPSMYLDKRLADDKDYGVNIFKPDAEACIKWLDARESSSVIYVSFGSVSDLKQDNMAEVALGLLQSNSYFLWIVRNSEQSKLPSNFMAEAKEKGLIVSWCPQLEVLTHKAVGSFFTHGGWNSTLEALSLGVPMIVLPHWFDQSTNAKYIADVWGTGARIKINEKGIVTKEEVAACIKDVMEGEKGKELRVNAIRWKELAIEAMDEGGRSDMNIDEFISKLEST